MLWVMKLVVLFFGSYATCERTRRLSLNTFRQILNTEVDVFHGESLFADAEEGRGSKESEMVHPFDRAGPVDDSLSWVEAGDHEWARARRQLGGVGKVPLVVCHDGEGDGYGRRLELLSHFTDHDESIAPLYNQADMSCWTLHASHTEATNAPDGFVIQPFSPPMKLVKGLIDGIKSDVSKNAHSLQLNLCASSERGSSDYRSIVDRIESAVKHELFDSHRNLLTEEIFGFHLHENWMNLDEEDATNKSCEEAFRGNLRIKSSLDFGSVYVENLDGAAAMLENNEGRCFVKLVAYLASLHEVCHVSPIPRQELRNFEAQWIVQSGVDGSRPFYDSGITGQGQVVAVSDTGLDKDNCYFRDSSGEVATTNYVSYSRSGPQYTDLNKRKVVQYNAFIDSTDDEDGHGTHVVGSVVGHKSTDGSSETTGFADGIAKDAKVAFFDVGQTNGGLMTPSDPSALFGPGRTSAGASFHSASWGNSNNAYGKWDFECDGEERENRSLTHPLTRSTNDLITNRCWRV